MTRCDQDWSDDCAEVSVYTEQIQGPPGPPGTDGIDGSGDKYYLHVQLVPSTVWTVIHNLGKRPSITAMFGDVNVGARVRHLDDNAAEIIFSSPSIGTASCN